MSKTTDITGIYRGFTLTVHEGADGNWTAAGRLECCQCGKDHLASERGPSAYNALENLRGLIDAMLGNSNDGEDSAEQ